MTRQVSIFWILQRATHYWAYMYFWLVLELAQYLWLFRPSSESTSDLAQYLWLFRLSSESTSDLPVVIVVSDLPRLERPPGPRNVNGLSDVWWGRSGGWVWRSSMVHSNGTPFRSSMIHKVMVVLISCNIHKWLHCPNDQGHIYFALCNLYQVLC